MNTQHQPYGRNLARRKRKAGKSKRFASSMILVGVITLIVTFALIFILAIITNFGDFHYSLGEATYLLRNHYHCRRFYWRTISGDWLLATG